MRRNDPRPQPALCSCMGTGVRAPEHAKPGKTAAEHGDVFAHTGACYHDELSRTTRARARAPLAAKLNLQWR